MSDDPTAQRELSEFASLGSDQHISDSRESDQRVSDAPEGDQHINDDPESDQHISDNPTRDDFQNALDAYWNDRPPASLEDVMALYGVLAVAESGGELYETPSELDPYIDKGRLITIYIDLTGQETEIVDVEQDTMRSDRVEKLGYAHHTAGRGSKYSLTQVGSATGNNAEGVASTILEEKLAGWVSQDPIQIFVTDSDHPDSWFITEIGSVLNKKSDTVRQLSNRVEESLPANESIPTVLTVRFRADASELISVDGTGVQWLWPADIGVLTEAMERYATVNATDKNIDSRPFSVGSGTGVVTGEESRVVGTPESPLDVFSVRHPDAQPSLRRSESWRNYPVSDDVALLFNKCRDLVNRCVYRNGGMETYALPYFAGEITAEKAEVLYLAIDSVDPDSKIGDSQDPPMVQVTFNLTEHDDPEIRQLAEEELRFYTVTMPIGDDTNVIAEEPAASTYWPTQIAESLRETIEGPTLTPSKGGFESSDNWPLLELDAQSEMQARRIGYMRVMNHEFTNAVFGYREQDSEDDDFRRIVDHRMLSGTSVDAQTLFEEYLQQLRDIREMNKESIDEQTLFKRYLKRYDDAGEPPPDQIVAQQLVHLETLSRAGLLNGIDTQIKPRQTTMATETTIDTSDIKTIREQRLDLFLDRPLFDDSIRRATAIAGVLVGQISWHQDSVRNIGRPLDASTKGDQLTKNALEHALTEALEKAKVYAQDSDESYHRNLIFAETIDRLLAETETMPSEWDIDKRELRFCYVLGHAHGRQSMPIAYDMHDGQEAEGDEAATA